MTRFSGESAEAIMPAHPDRRLHVGYMVGTFPALTETFVIREIEGLRSRGLDVTVFAIKRATLREHERSLLVEDPPDVVYARPESVAHHLLANFGAFLSRPVAYLRTIGIFTRGSAGLSLRERLAVLYHAFTGIGYSREMRRRGVDRLHCHFATGTNVALSANLFDGIPFSFTAHASGDIYMRPVLLCEKIARADFVIPSCDYNRSFLDAVTSYEYTSKLVRIYTGVDPDEAGRLCRQAAAESRPAGTIDVPSETGEAPLIASVGSLVPMKGHATLLKACAELREREVAFRCEIVGGGPERPTLENLLQTLELEDSVSLLGPKSLRETYGVLRRAVVLAHLSEIDVDGYRDGFPTVILEAMTLGLPVVTTWVSGNPESVEHGVTGILVHERNVGRAADALELLLGDQELRRRMGAAGRARVEERFRADQASDRLVSLLQSASQGPSLAERVRSAAVRGE